MSSTEPRYVRLKPNGAYIRLNNGPPTAFIQGELSSISRRMFPVEQ